MSKEHDLTESLAELGEMIDRNVARIATLEDTLARKQRAIDAALEARRSGLTAAAVADILRPEATDAKPLPHGVSPVGKPQPSGDPGQLPTIGQHHPDDPLKTEWTADGFRITQQPEEWRDNFDETHAGICVRSASCPDWCGELWLRGEETETDSDDVRVTAADRPRVWAAICSLNAKHRPKASQPAPAEPSGDRALRLVKILASLVRKHCTPVDADLLILDKIVAECGAAEGASDERA